jgi:hypothetical protein
LNFQWKKYVYSIFNISDTLCLRITKSHPCNSLLIIEGLSKNTKIAPTTPILILLNFQWQNYSKLNNSCTRIGLYIAKPTLVHLHWELSNNTKVGGGGWLPWFGRSPCDKPKTNKQTTFINRWIQTLDSLKLSLNLPSICKKRYINLKSTNKRK